jgi:protein-S-isoprenylcysteine O-methyltransferase Ste14
MTLTEKLKLGFLKLAGYLIPLAQSFPPLGIWTGLMTLPFASYLMIMVANLPEHLPSAIMNFFVIPFLIPEKIVIITGILILTYSIIHLWIKRKSGLVTSGSYGLIRHPQYLGFVLITLGFTSWSVWILNNTFGIGFLSPIQTTGLWFIELLAYIILAQMEERHLSKKYGELFHNYKKHTPFFIPFLKTDKSYLEVLAAAAIPAILLFVLLTLGFIPQPPSTFS